jgi:DNA-binding CsgD family transcriptional regulator
MLSRLSYCMRRPPGTRWTHSVGRDRSGPHSLLLGMPRGCHHGLVAATIPAARQLLAQTVHADLPFADGVMRSLNSAIGFDGYCLFAVDPITGLRSAMYAAHGLKVPTERLVHNETVEHDVNRYSTLSQRQGHVGLLSLRAAPEPPSPRLHEIMRPEGYVSELRLVLVADGRYWGALSLFRDERRHPFTTVHEESAQDMAGPLCAALRRHQIRRPGATRDARRAGAVLVGADGRLLSVSPEAQEWLVDLTSAGSDGITVDDASRMLHEVAHATVQGQPNPSCRVRTREGRWLIISGTTTPLTPVAATVVIQPAAVDQTLPAFAAWSGLSRREAQIAQLLARGLATKQIARRLDLSIHTVNDHLQSTYRKAGVNARDELLALLI